MSWLGRRWAWLFAAGCLAGAITGALALSAAPVGAAHPPHIQEPSPDGVGPDQYAQVVASGDQVVVVIPITCQRYSGRLQIRATLSQASTEAFGEGTVDFTCALADQVVRVPVTAVSGHPAFSDGTAEVSAGYETLDQRFGRQWSGELTLVDQLPSDNPLGTAFRDRLGAPWWLVIVLAVVSGVLLLATAALLVRGRGRAGSGST